MDTTDMTDEQKIDFCFQKETKPITSVIVVTKTLDAIAGSIFIFFNDTGTKIPKRPATTIVSTIEIDIIKDNCVSLNHN